MKLHIHTALWNQTWEDDVVPFVEAAARAGYGGVEVSLLGDADGFARVRRRAEQLRLAVSATTGLSSATDIGSQDPTVRERGRAALVEAVAAAESLGARQLSGVIYGAWGVHDPKRRTERWAYAVEALRSVAPIARDAGVMLGIEAINRYETDLVNTAEQACAMAAEVDDASVGVLLDAYHMNIEEKDMAAAIRRAGNTLVHLHVAGRDRGVPPADWLRNTGLRDALHDIGYQGLVTCEMFVQADVAVSEDLTVWRPIERDVNEAAHAAHREIEAWLS